MALTWSVSKVADWEEIVAETEINPMGGEQYVDGLSVDQMNQDRITTWLISVTMFIGMNEITSKNVDEFFRRISMFQQAKPDRRVNLFYGSLGDKVTMENYRRTPVTFDDVQRRIGLHTNAESITKAKFDEKYYTFFGDVSKSKFVG
tara:strand:+ start:1016 stop:1456 length:441 start_codon:yes stop_codon:yes gene_type:complete